MAVLAFVYSFLGRKVTTVSKPKSYVIIYTTNNVGDMVCATPIFRAIKKHDADTVVVLVGSPKLKDLMDDNADIDEYINIDQSIWWQMQTLRQREFDAGIAVNPDAISIATLLLGNVKCISCFYLDGEYENALTRPYRLISKLVNRVPYTPGMYVPSQNLKLLNPFGIYDEDATKRLGFSTEYEEVVKNKLRDSNINLKEPYVVIAPGAGAEYKRWPGERFAQVAEYIQSEHRMPVVIVGGPNDQHATREMMDALGSGSHVCDYGHSSLNELKVLLAHACLVIGNDSGAVHAGEALGAATLTISGPTDDAEHMREDEHHRVLRSEERSQKDLYRSFVGKEEKIDNRKALLQLEAIGIEEVNRTADEILSLINPSTNHN